MLITGPTVREAVVCEVVLAIVAILACLQQTSLLLIAVCRPSSFLWPPVS